MEKGAESEVASGLQRITVLPQEINALNPNVKTQCDFLGSVNISPVDTKVEM